MIIRNEYIIEGKLLQEALIYADLSGAYTSNRHDFHAGGLHNKKVKMLEGKLGEKAFKQFLLDNHIPFIEDHSSWDERDEYDFLLTTIEAEYLLDVKTRTKPFHTRTLEMVEQAQSHPKDIFISTRLHPERNAVQLLGWYTYDDMIDTNRIENNGYLNNYVMYDQDLRPLDELYNFVLVHCI
ncbi:MAG: hypothetical protein K2O91_17665 [Lachnospiraceae bacterium]|nr:hypothetical protein [Lachnospiraceae bacterium]